MIGSDIQSPSPVTTLSWELGTTMMPELVLARLIYSFVMVRVGESRQNSQQATPRRVTTSDGQSPSPVTMS